MRRAVINLRGIWPGKRTLVVMVLATILSTLAIRATDRFFTASVKEASDFTGCPPDMVFVTSENGGFCIDKYENSPSPECTYSNPKSQTETRVNLDKSSCKPVSVPGAIPWRNISQNQAALACAKVGKRLPTNKEWFQAALGTPDISSGWTPEDCNVNSSGPRPTGSATKCVSFAGVYDMIGNVWEWVGETVADGIYENRTLPEQGFVWGVDENGMVYETNFDLSNPEYNHDFFWVRHEGVRGICRGGYWDNKSDAGIYAAYLVVPPAFSGIGVGFRCVK